LFGVSGEQSVSLMHQCISGLRDLRDVLEEVLPRIGFNGRADDFIRYWFGKDSRLNAEVIRLVEDLRTSGAADLYIATGQEHHRAKYLWNNLGLSKCFDGMFYSADIGLPKTNVRFFEAINRRLGIAAAERPIFFDDQAMIVDLARAVGWDATPYTSARDVVEHPRLLALWSFSQTDSR
jgi:putative hydrolase of the HAD superfamily